MLHSRILKATYTKRWSPYFMKFLRVISLYSTRSGKIVYDEGELAQQVGVQRQTIHKYLRRAVYDELIYLKDRNYYFKYNIDDHNYRQGYTPSFEFLHSDEFNSLDLHSIRFIQHCLYEGVHSGRTLSFRFKDLYNSMKSDSKKIINVKGIEQGLQSVQEATKYLDIHIDYDQQEVIIKGLLHQWTENVLEKKGKQIELDKIIYAFREEHNVSRESRITILKKKDTYYKKYGVEVTERIFDKALPQLLNHYTLHIADREGTIGALLETICDNILCDRPEWIEQAADYQKKEIELKEIELSHSYTNNKAKHFHNEKKTRLLVIESLKEMMRNAFRTKKWFEDELNELYAAVAGIKNFYNHFINYSSHERPLLDREVIRRRSQMFNGIQT